MRGRPAKLVPALVVAAVACAVAPSAAGAAQRCSAPHAKTVVENSQARVFYVKGKGKVKRRFYGCARGAKPFLLATNLNPKSDEDTHTQNTRFQLAGTYVAFVSTAESDFGAGEFGRSIEVRGLKKRARKVDIDVSDYGSVAALAVRDDGAAAWILNTFGVGDYREVDALDSGSKAPNALAYARGIEPPQLTFDATSVTWTQDGAPRSAPVG